jgi:hypothetical protein
MDSNSVLSLCPDLAILRTREATLEEAGFNVVSVTSTSQARFEIEMGRCGNLLLCHRVSSAAAGDLTKLYRTYCPQGRIIFIRSGTSRNKIPPEIDIAVSESQGHEAIVHAVQGDFNSVTTNEAGEEIHNE